MIGDRERLYRAFLSYSHRDAAQARWLHRRLEGYRLPKRLVGTAGEHGPVPARLAPIFRDREELPAAGDLSEKVRAALTASDNLIVICSPHSAASPWVAKEIAAFRELHPGRPVLAAILEGEPPHCFPAGLAEDGAEPLAADLRAGRDGRRLGLLKLVAGLAGVGLDALVQRDAARRIRRVTAVTGGALAAMVAMAIMTAVALSSRAEAERQRAEAEGLVEFMLTDLRERLREVGRLDVHSTVNQRAIAYYASQGALADLPDDSLERRARVLHAMGEDDEKRGDKASALARFREAYATTQETLARHPADPGAIFAHAQSEYWLGYMSYIGREWPQTERRWRRYRDLADRLLATDGSKLEWLREAGYAAGNLCTLEIARRGEPSAALRECGAAVVAMEKVSSLTPHEQRAVQDLANRHAWLGDAWRTAGSHGRALAEYRTQERLLRPWVQRRPRDANLQDQWMRALMTIAEALDDAGEAREADTYRRRARSIATSLIDHDPLNARWKRWLRRIDQAAQPFRKGDDNV